MLMQSLQRYRRCVHHGHRQLNNRVSAQHLANHRKQHSRRRKELKERASCRAAAVLAIMTTDATQYQQASTSAFVASERNERHLFFFFSINLRGSYSRPLTLAIKDTAKQCVAFKSTKRAQERKERCSDSCPLRAGLVRKVLCAKFFSPRETRGRH